ncbi:MAG: DUF2608 domain-containing protein [Xanthomonadales bacterium]|nr:DUF2608 domain-containing protein [Xanthomonadales bacterium]
MKRVLPALVLAVSLVGCATTSHHAEVRRAEIDRLADLLPAAETMANRYGAGNVLVAFDLDNTLLAMRTELGADQWYDWQKRLQSEDPCHPAVVPDRLAAQGALYHEGAMQLTEPAARELVDELREKGHPVMIITARGADFRLATFRELRRNGLSFLESAPGPWRGYDGSLKLEGATRPVLYEDGVLMLAGQHKGRMLLGLYAHAGLPLPPAIVFVDDKAYNTQAMAEALEAAEVDAYVYRYSGEDKRVDNFDPAAAAAAWSRMEGALQVVESVMGEVNFDLPDNHAPAGCP